MNYYGFVGARSGIRTRQTSPEDEGFHRENGPNPEAPESASHTPATRNVVTAALAIGFCLTGCEPEADLVVGKVGDSIMANMGEELDFEAQSLSRGPAMTTLAALPCTALGRELSYFTRRISSLRERVQVDAVVVSLGTNDASFVEGFLETWSYVDTQDELGAAIDGLLGSLPSVPVLWLVPASPASDPERLAHIRLGLERATERWPHLVLVDQDVAWFVAGDGTHHSARGEALAARELVTRIRALERP